MKNFTSNPMQVCCCSHPRMKRRALPVTPSRGMDIAVAMDRFSASTLRISLIEHKWAGLRSFAADREFVVGFDPRDKGFYWLAGQGGYRVQTAPGLAKLSASLLLDAADRRPVQMALYLELLAPERLMQ